MSNGDISFYGGDISFYDDTGTSQALFWDASAEGLGIGTTSPDTTLDVTTGGIAGIILNQDTSNSAASSRLFFKDSTRTNAIVNISGNLEFRTDATIGVSSGTTRLVVNGDGNVGIGTSSPSDFAANANNLVVGSGSGTEGITINSGTANYGVIYFADGTSGSAAYAGNINYNHADNSMRLGTNGSTTDVVIDSSGNLLVGKTVSGATTGGEIRSSGQGNFRVDGGHGLLVDRKTNNGDLAIFQKDGTTVGVIQSYYGDLKIGTGDTAIIFGDGQDAIYPGNTTGGAVDATIDLGLAIGSRFKDLYLSGTAKVDSSAYISQGALTSSSNAVAWDAAAKANAYYATTENTTFAAPTNAVEGAIISVEIAQGATPYTVAWNTVFEFAASTAPTVTATANKTDIFSFRYNGSVWQEIGRTQNMAQT